MRVLCVMVQSCLFLITQELRDQKCGSSSRKVTFNLVLISHSNYTAFLQVTRQVKSKYSLLSSKQAAPSRSAVSIGCRQVGKLIYMDVPGTLVYWYITILQY